MPTAQIAHLQFAQANAQTQNCKRAILPKAPINRSIYKKCEKIVLKNEIKKINFYILANIFEFSKAK